MIVVVMNHRLVALNVAEHGMIGGHILGVVKKPLHKGKHGKSEEALGHKMTGAQEIVSLQILGDR